MKKIIIILVIIIVVGFSGVTYAFSQPPQLPEPKATLEIQKGSAFVNDQPAKTGDELKQNDTIKTGADSLAIINFYNQSTTRLDANTQIILKDLKTENAGAKTTVTIKATVGHIWSRVVKMVDKESKFEVETPTTVATVRGTAFDALVKDTGEESLVTTENIVTVAINDPKTGKNLATTDLSENQQATLNSKKMPSSPLELMYAIKTAGPNVLKSAWATQNLDLDKKFADLVTQREKEALDTVAGITPDSSLYGLKTFSQTIRTSLTFGVNAKTGLQIQYANQKLAEAGKMLDEGQKDLAGKLMQNYSSGLSVALSNLDQLKNSGQTKAYDEISKNIQDQMASAKNNIATALPDSDLYQIKQRIEAVQLQITPDALDNAALQLQFATDRLKEAKELIAQGKNDLGKSTLDDYAKQLDSMKKLTDSLKGQTPDVINKIMTNASQNAIQNQEMLNTMEAMAPPQIKEQITAQKVQALEKANEMIKADPAALYQFQNDVMKNAAASIPQEYLDKNQTSDWLKNVEVARDQIKQQIINALPAGASLPENFAIPDFAVKGEAGAPTIKISPEANSPTATIPNMPTVSPGLPPDYNNYIPKEFQQYVPSTSGGSAGGGSAPSAGTSPGSNPSSPVITPPEPISIPTDYAPSGSSPSYPVTDYPNPPQNIPSYPVTTSPPADYPTSSSGGGSSVPTGYQK